MKLHEAMRQLVTQFGQEVIGEMRLVNMLADLNGFEEYPAMNQVLRTLYKDGYGERVYDVYVKQASDIVTESSSLAAEMVRKHRYKPDLVNYAFDCLLWALDCVGNVSEPLTRGFDFMSKGNAEILDNLQVHVVAMKKQYLDLLDKLVTLPKNLLTDAPAFYTAEAKCRLYAVEAKLSALLQQSGAESFAWCGIQYDNKLKSLHEAEKAAVEKQRGQLLEKSEKALIEYKQSYRELLTSNIIIPKKLSVRWSGYYDSDTLRKLDDIEVEMKKACSSLGIAYDGWCEREKQSFLKKNMVEVRDILKPYLFRIVLPVLLLIWLLNIGTGYVLAKGAREQFEQTIQQGEQCASRNNYTKALLLFEKAEKDYHGHFMTKHYTGIAHTHMKGLISKVSSQIDKLINQGQLLEARLLLDSLPQSVVKKDAESVAVIENVLKYLEQTVNGEIEELIANISSNRGHLNRQGKAKLDNLLKVSPNNYWLNIIKEKEK